MQWGFWALVLTKSHIVTGLRYVVCHGPEVPRPHQGAGGMRSGRGSLPDLQMAIIIASAQGARRQPLCCVLCAGLFEVFMCDSLHVHAYAGTCLWRAEEGTKHPTAGVSEGCEPPNLTAGSQTQSLCKSSNALNHWTIFISPALENMSSLLFWAERWLSGWEMEMGGFLRLAGQPTWQVSCQRESLS